MFGCLFWGQNWPHKSWALPKIWGKTSWFFGPFQPCHYLVFLHQNSGHFPPYIWSREPLCIDEDSTENRLPVINPMESNFLQSRKTWSFQTPTKKQREWKQKIRLFGIPQKSLGTLKKIRPSAAALSLPCTSFLPIAPSPKYRRIGPLGIYSNLWSILVPIFAIFCCLCPRTGDISKCCT